jgi:hypothetical protein
MKTNIHTMEVFLKSTVFVFVAFAIASIEAFAAGHGGGAANLPACQAPVAACKQAKFVVGAHKPGDKEGADDGLWVDCIDAVADNKKQVPGLTQSAAEACRTAKKAMKQKH